MAFAVPTTVSVVVSNEKYDNPDDHTYAVVVDDGLPVHCSCPAERRYSTACKHRIAIALQEPVLRAAEGDVDDMILDGDDAEDLLADGGQVKEHVDGCSDPACEGLQADGRPELSFECWEEWATQYHDWTDERGDEPADIAREHELVEQQAPDCQDATTAQVERAMDAISEGGWI